MDTFNLAFASVAMGTILSQVTAPDAVRLTEKLGVTGMLAFVLWFILKDFRDEMRAMRRDIQNLTKAIVSDDKK